MDLDSADMNRFACLPANSPWSMSVTLQRVTTFVCFGHRIPPSDDADKLIQSQAMAAVQTAVAGCTLALMIP
jgi:hypothetical protein